MAPVSVTVGSVESPVSFWVAPANRPKWLIHLEQDLDMLYSLTLTESVQALGGGDEGSVREALDNGDLVAVRTGWGGFRHSDREVTRGGDPRGRRSVGEGVFRGWKRGRLLGEVLEYQGRADKATFFLVDTGEVTEMLELDTCVRIIPEHLVKASEGPQAVNLVIRGLVPISRMVPLEMLLEEDCFGPAVCRDWAESASFMIHALLAAASKHRSKTTQVTIRIRQQETVCRASGELAVRLGKEAAASPRLAKFKKLFQPDKEIDVRTLLLDTEHAVKGSSPAGAEHLKPALTLLKEPRPKKDALDPWEIECVERRQERRKSRHAAALGNFYPKEQAKPSAAEERIKVKNDLFKKNLLREVRVRRLKEGKETSAAARDEGVDACGDGGRGERDEEEWIMGVWDSIRHRSVRANSARQKPHLQIMEKVAREKSHRIQSKY